MRTLGLSLGLALLCLLRVQAADLGGAELDEKKVSLGKGREWGSVLSGHQQSGEDSRGRGVLVLRTAEVATAATALLSHPGEGSHPAPA